MNKSALRSKSNQVQFSNAELRHSKQIQKLVSLTDRLQANGSYFYAIFCTEFSETSFVALRGTEVIAFVIGFMLPKRPDTYFLWQTAVKPRHGVPNLALDLIHFGVNKRIESGAVAVSASVDDENVAINQLLSALARRMDGRISTKEMFSAEEMSFGHDRTHSETLIRVEWP